MMVHRFLATYARSLLFAVVTLVATSTQAQVLTLYDDAFQNSFSGGYSYGAPAPTFDSTAQAHSGTKSISFVGTDYNAVGVGRGPDVNAATYPVLRFWVHGGAAGGQQLRIYVARTPDAGGPETYLGNVDLDSYIAGGGVVAGAWREVTVNLTQAPFNATFFDRIDIQSDQAPPQPEVFIDDITVGPVMAQPSAPLQIIPNDTVNAMLGERFIWRDSNNQPREAMLAYNNGQAGPDGGTGGSLRQFKYQLPNNATRTAGLTGYGAGDGGFGYVVMHASGSACVGDDSPLGGFQPGNGFERVFEGRHHAIFRFRQNYPRNCAASGGAVARTIPVTIDWMFSTGRDNPIWAVTYDIILATPAAMENTFNDDSRAPYGELAIDGDGATNLSGVAWGDRYKFTSTGAAPVTLNSSWTWNTANTVPYVKEWLNGPLTVDNKLDATMGIVQTRTMAQQDAGGGRSAGPGSMTNFWTKTSGTVVGGNACTNPTRTHPFPCADDWPYQANANSLDFAYPNGSNNARLTWKTQYGFIGQLNYTTYNGLVDTEPGWPKKSYSTYIVLGTHTSSPVEAQVTQVETVQSLTFTPTIGTVVTTGPAGVTRPENVTYAPAGYNHVYGALAFNAAGNQLDMNINVGAGTLTKPLIIVGNYTAGDPQLVKFAGVTLTADADYFASVRATVSELWITLNRDLTGAVNRLEITGGGLGTPTNFVATATSTSQVTMSWTAVADAVNYEIHRSSLNSAYTLLITIAAPGTMHDDIGPTADRTYLYKVRALGPGGPSGFSPVDPATTILFTDDPINAGTLTKAIHVTQLRTAVNAMRAAAPGLAAQAFTDTGLAAGTSIKRVHVTELRTALDAARAAIGLTALVYADPVITAGATTVKAAHVTNLRAGVK